MLLLLSYKKLGVKIFNMIGLFIFLARFLPRIFKEHSHRHNSIVIIVGAGGAGATVAVPEVNLTAHLTTESRRYVIWGSK